MATERIEQKTSEWEGLKSFPIATVKYYNPQKGFGYCTVGVKEYYLDTRNVFPALVNGAPKRNGKYVLHLVSEKSPTRQGRQPSATCVWGNPARINTVIPAIFTDGKEDKIYLTEMTEEGSLEIVNNIILPPTIKLDDLELGAGYETATFDGTQMYSSISLLGSKKISKEDIEKERLRIKFIPITEKYKKWLTVDNPKDDLPENVTLQYNSRWFAIIGNKERPIIIDPINNCLIVTAVTETSTQKVYDDNVDDFGDVGQAIGGNGFHSGISRNSKVTTTIEEAIEYKLPPLITKVYDENVFDHVKLEKILSVKRAKNDIPFFYIAEDEKGNKIAYWSEKYKCWQHFTDKTLLLMQEITEYDNNHFTSNIKSKDPDINKFFTMITMAKKQQMTIDPIAPWTNDL